MLYSLRYRIFLIFETRPIHLYDFHGSSGLPFQCMLSSSADVCLLRFFSLFIFKTRIVVSSNINN
jgi:hypothetical protein